jgi:hypothetical protein
MKAALLFDTCSSSKKTRKKEDTAISSQEIMKK